MKIEILQVVTGGGENWNSPIKAVKGVLQRESEMLHITNDDDHESDDDDKNDDAPHLCYNKE